METGSRGSKRIHVNVSYFSTSVRRLPHLPEVPHLHVKRPLKQTTLQLYLNSGFSLHRRNFLTYFQYAIADISF